MDRILIVIPVFNEAKNITKVIRDIRNNFPEADILAVNDLSTDETPEILESLGVNRLDLPFNMGYAGAMQAGIKYGQKWDYDYIVQFDGDGQHMAGEIIKLVDHIRKHRADIVIGSRFLTPSDYPHPLLRRLGSRIFSLLIRVSCGKRITDPTSGFQILNRRVIDEYSGTFNYPEYPDANLIIKMILNGYRIEEVSASMKPREYGTSMHAGIIGPAKYMIHIVYSILLILLTFRSAKSPVGGTDE